MSNPLFDLIKLVTDKRKHKVGRIINQNGNVFVIQDISGSKLQVTGDTSFKIGMFVLVDGNRIVGTVNENFKQVWVP